MEKDLRTAPYGNLKDITRAMNRSISKINVLHEQIKKHSKGLSRALKNFAEAKRGEEEMQDFLNDLEYHKTMGLKIQKLEAESGLMDTANAGNTWKQSRMSKKIGKEFKFQAEVVDAMIKEANIRLKDLHISKFDSQRILNAYYENLALHVEKLKEELESNFSRSLSVAADLGATIGFTVPKLSDFITEKGEYEFKVQEDLLLSEIELDGDLIKRKSEKESERE